MEIVSFHNLEITIERKAFYRGYSLVVHPDRPIRLRVAMLTSQAKILEILTKKKLWLEKHHQRFHLLKKEAHRPLLPLQEFPFRGQKFRLKPVITPQGKYFFSRTESDLLVHVPRDEWSAEIYRQEFSLFLPQLREFYRRESITHLSQRVAVLSEKMGLFPSQVRWKETRSRWGSCSMRGNIQLNWRMIVFADEITDYIVAHELAHLKHFNHSKAFWKTVEEAIPDASQLRKTLRKQQMLANFLDLPKAKTFV